MGRNVEGLRMGVSALCPLLYHIQRRVDPAPGLINSALTQMTFWMSRTAAQVAGLKLRGTERELGC